MESVDVDLEEMSAPMRENHERKWCNQQYFTCSVSRKHTNTYSHRTLPNVCSLVLEKELNMRVMQTIDAWRADLQYIGTSAKCS